MFNKIFRKEIDKRALAIAYAIVSVREYNERSREYHKYCDEAGISMMFRTEYTDSRPVDRFCDELVFFQMIKDEEEVIKRLLA